MNQTIIVLAAGMGSRYGGLKQLDQFGPSGEAIIDYSLYDAKEAGFTKVVFVIRKHMETEFRARFEDKLKGKLDLHFVFQELDVLPKGFTVPDDREKPWGTAHAMWMANSVVNEPFTVINADDFYGRSAYELSYNHFLKNTVENCLVGYELAKTISEFGSVSRGVCSADENGYLEKINERTKIYRNNGILGYEENDQFHELSEMTNVSMNMMGFTPSIFDYIEENFSDFLQKHGHELKSEFFLPLILEKLITSDRGKVKVYQTDEQWFGVTYQEDKAHVTDQINGLVEKGIYPPKLW